MVLTPEVRFINDWGRGDISGTTGETPWWDLALSTQKKKLDGKVRH